MAGIFGVKLILDNNSISDYNYNTISFFYKKIID